MILLTCMQISFACWFFFHQLYLDSGLHCVGYPVRLWWGGVLKIHITRVFPSLLAEFRNTKKFIFWITRKMHCSLVSFCCYNHLTSNKFRKSAYGFLVNFFLAYISQLFKVLTLFVCQNFREIVNISNFVCTGKTIKHKRSFCHIFC